MKRTRTELKTELMTHAEMLIDELLDWTADTPVPTLTQIEEVILEFRKRLSAQVARAVIEAQDATRPVPGPRCPTCQREMHYKDRKDHTVESRVGSLRLERGYYYCQTCRAGVFPPRSATGIVGPALE